MSGWGEDILIGDLARLIGDVVGFASVRFDPAKPDGTPRKLLNGARLRAVGWRSKMRLREGVAATYRWFVEDPAHYRG